MSSERNEAELAVKAIFKDQAPATAEAFAQMIEAANAANPNGWELTLDRSERFLRLNAGAIFIADAFRDKSRLRFAIERGSKGALPDGVEFSEPFLSTPVALLEMEVRDVENHWP